MIHRVPVLRPNHEAICTRCRSVIARPAHARRSIRLTAAFALAGLIVYFPAILLPILEIEKLGHRYESGILVGCFELLRQGSVFVALVILVFSIILPPVKLILMLVLCTGRLLGRRHRAWTYRVLEHLGRWGMLDVLLVAILVALVKLGDLVRFHVGPAVWFFSVCVGLSILASASFDPRAIWDETS